MGWKNRKGACRMALEVWGMAVLAATALVLAGCGGGGGATSSGNPAPSDAGGDSTAWPIGLQLAPQPASMDVSVYAAQDATLGSSVTGVSGTTVSRGLGVYDLRSHQLAWRKPLAMSPGRDPTGAAGASMRDWLVVPRQRQATDRLSHTELGAGSLYFVEGPSLKRLNLAAASLEPAQLASTSVVCGMGGEFMPLRDDGSRALLRVLTPSANGDCAGRLTSRWIDTGAASQPGRADQTAFELPLLRLEEAGGAVRGIVDVRRTVGLSVVLRVVAGDLFTVLADLPTGVRNANPRPSVEVFPAGLGDVRLRLVRVGAQVRLLDWRSGKAVLSEPLFTLSSASDTAVVAVDSDGQRVYVGEACQLRAIDAQGQVTQLGTVGPQDGHISAVRVWGNRVVVNTDGAVHLAVPGCPATSVSLPTGRSLQAFSTSGGTATRLQPGLPLALLGDDTLVYEAQGSAGRVTIRSQSLSTGAGVTDWYTDAQEVLRIQAPSQATPRPTLKQVVLVNALGKYRVLSLDGSRPQLGSEQTLPLSQGDGGAGSQDVQQGWGSVQDVRLGVPALRQDAFSMTVASPVAGQPATSSRFGWNVWQVDTSPTGRIDWYRLPAPYLQP